MKGLGQQDTPFTAILGMEDSRMSRVKVAWEGTGGTERVWRWVTSTTTVGPISLSLTMVPTSCIAISATGPSPTYPGRLESMIRSGAKVRDSSILTMTVTWISTSPTTLDFKYETQPVCGAYAPARRSYCDPDAFAGVADRLYRNRGDGTFDDISERSGIANPEGKGLGVVMADIDSDGWMDIYVANDKTRNFLFKNNGDLTFSDISYFSLTGFNAAGEAEAGMGTDFGDVDGDGLLDLMSSRITI